MSNLINIENARFLTFSLLLLSFFMLVFGLYYIAKRPSKKSN